MFQNQLVIGTANFNQNYGLSPVKVKHNQIINCVVANDTYSENKELHWNINYKGVSINTKSIKKNNLFFAIRGKNTDGHLFIKDAIRKGAIKSVISKKIKPLSKNKIIKVENTFSRHLANLDYLISFALNIV